MKPIQQTNLLGDLEKTWLGQEGKIQVIPWMRTLAYTLEQEHTVSQPSKPARRLRYTSDEVSFLELFSGTGRLSNAVRKAGMRVLPDFEISKDPIYDLLNPKIQDFIISLLTSGLVW